MDTSTTYFPAPSIVRSRVDRSADGVVAGYVRALAGAATPDARPENIQTDAAADQAGSTARLADADGADMQTWINPGRSKTYRSLKRNPCWNRGGRVSAFRAQRAAQAN